MSLKCNAWQGSLRIAALCLTVLIASLSFAAPAKADVTTAELELYCSSDADGSAYYRVRNTLPVGESYWLTLKYDNGHTTAAYNDDGSNMEGSVFGSYAAPLDAGSADADEVTATVWSNETTPEGVVSAELTLHRNPECGERPNRPPNVNDAATSGTRYDSVIEAPLMGLSDPDGDEITVSVLTPPSHGTAEIREADPSSDARYVLVYHPDGSFVGDDTATYQVADGRGGVSSATVTVTVNDASTITAPAPTFIQPDRQNSSGQLIIPAVDGVRYSFESATLSEYEASGLVTFPQGTLVTVTAFATQPGTVLVGDRSWGTRYTYLLQVQGASSGYVNRVKVVNRNPFGTWFRYGDFTSPGFAQDGRVWVEAGSSRFVATARKTLDWAASGGGDWQDRSRVRTTQIRPKGRVVIDCTGRRNLVKAYVNNVASTVPVRLTLHVGHGDHLPFSVAAGSTRSYRWGYVRPRMVVRLVANTRIGDIVLDREVAPRGCRD